MIKAYAITAMYALLPLISGYLVIWGTRLISPMIKDFSTIALDFISHLKEKSIAMSNSELVRIGVEEAYVLATPIVKAFFETASKKLIEIGNDGKIDKKETTDALIEIGKMVDEHLKAATQIWKIKMKPLTGDPDKLLEAIKEDIYAGLKRNFRERNSEPAQPSGVPPQK